MTKKKPASKKTPNSDATKNKKTTSEPDAANQPAKKRSFQTVVAASTSNPVTDNAAPSPVVVTVESIRSIVLQLRNRTGHDFSVHEIDTLRRFIERRMKARRINDPAEYVRYLQEDPPEIESLFNELVTLAQHDTERITAAEVLYDREERMRAILNTAADAIITIDHRGVIDSVNPATEKIFGYSQEELIGQNISTLMPSPYCEEHDGYIARYLETGEARIIGIGREVVGKRRDGSTFPLDLAVSEVDHLGLFTGIIRDISDRVEIREKLVQSERLAAIGEAMTGLAHESRNALQRSQACLDLLAEQMEGRPDSLELLSAIQRAQDELHRLYEEVRAYASPLNIRPQSCHVGEIVLKAWNDVAVLRNGRAAEIEEHSTCEDLHCYVDSFAMGQVFRNILENALHACGDPIQIHVQYTDADFKGTSAISIAVRDNGPGISAEHAQRIFQSFFTTKSAGTGLGMAIAQRIVQAQGGAIALNPDCESGAEFIVTLPRKQP